MLANILPISRWNPDRHFNIKEHALITIMSNVSFGKAKLVGHSNTHKFL